MVKKIKFICFISCILMSYVSSGQDLNYVFKAGNEGYSCYRIPAIIKTTKGTLLAFAEGRKLHCGDAGDIDLVLKRSVDNGKTWGPLELVWSDSTNTCGNPSPVQDKVSGRIILLSTWNLGTDHESDIISKKSKDTRRIFVLSSDDEGTSWSVPKEITGSVKSEQWTWYATGPGNAIQLQKGKHVGRLVVPCDHIEADSKKYFSHTIYSDDAGSTWHLGGTTPQDKVNECAVAELSNGNLMLNMRNYSNTRSRQVALSKDAGESWSDMHVDTTLIEPICQGSLIRYDFSKHKNWLLFSNPANAKTRMSMTVRWSKDRGKTWPISQLVYAGPSAYSNLVVLPAGQVACYFEGGIKNPYEGIAFSTIASFGKK